MSRNKRYNRPQGNGNNHKSQKHKNYNALDRLISAHNRKYNQKSEENDQSQQPYKDFIYLQKNNNSRHRESSHFPDARRRDKVTITPQVEGIEVGSNNNFVLNFVFDYNANIVSKEKIQETKIGHGDIDYIQELSDLEIGFKPTNYKPKEGHFHYPIEAMLKLIVFKRLNRIKYNNTLVKILEKNDNNIKQVLGFNGHVPARNTIGYFYNHYLGIDGHQDFYDKTLQDLKWHMDSRGIKFGERVGIDSTPLPTAKYDPIGEVNPHYYEKMGIYKMVKVHILSCLDTGLPIAITFSSGTAHDSQFLIPLIEKAKSLGFNIKECYADGAYDSTEHWAELSVKHGIDCYFTIRENAVEHADSTKDKIRRRYQKYHDKDGWVQTNDFDTILKFMLKVGETKRVGNHFRNAWVRTMKYHEYEYQSRMGERSKCENLHSILKEQMLFVKNLEGKGWPKIKMHTFQFMITMIVIATIRAKYGIKEGFNKISEGLTG